MNSAKSCLTAKASEQLEGEIENELQAEDPEEIEKVIRANEEGEA